MSFLRDYWFPLLLALLGAAVSVAATMSEGSARRWWLGLCVTLLYLSTMSFIFGDPVRGPFYGAIHPKKGDRFTLYAGATVALPVRQLAGGIDFSRMINLPNNPIRLSIRKTWWAGRHYDLSLVTNEGVVDLVKNNEIQDVNAAHLDVNFDNDAIEMVDSDNRPVFQLVNDGDYNVHVNAVIDTGNGRAIVMREKRLSIGKRLAPSDFPSPLFRYPSYANRGRRQ